MNNEEERPMDSDTALATSEGQPGFFGELWQQTRLIYRLFRDPEVPVYLKLIPVAAFAYLLFPLDFIPDVIPGLGQLDDITILLVGAKMFIEMAPQHIVERYIYEMQSNSPPAGEQPAEEYSSDSSDIIEGIIVEEDSAFDSDE